MQVIHIVTPCTRPENLERISESIWDLKKRRVCGVYWYVVFDTNKLSEYDMNHMMIQCNEYSTNPMFLLNGHTGTAGHQHRNLVLRIIKERDYKGGWFYSVDDDNILHEDFHRIFTNFSIKDKAAVVFNQLDPNTNKVRLGDGGTYLYAKPEQMKVYHVDTAQVMFNLEYVNGMRYDEFAYNADGKFVEALYNKNKNFIFINENMCYYNYLK